MASEYLLFILKKSLWRQNDKFYHYLSCTRFFIRLSDVRNFNYFFLVKLPSYSSLLLLLNLFPKRISYVFKYMILVQFPLRLDCDIYVIAI